MIRPLSVVTIAVLSAADLVFPFRDEAQQMPAGPAIGFVYLQRERIVAWCVFLYKIGRILSGSGSERLATSSHTSLIRQNLPQSFTLGSATSAVQS
jgi:hypothetical protein